MPSDAIGFFAHLSIGGVQRAPRVFIHFSCINTGKSSPYTVSFPRNPFRERSRRDGGAAKNPPVFPEKPRLSPAPRQTEKSPASGTLPKDGGGRGSKESARREIPPGAFAGACFPLSGFLCGWGAGLGRGLSSPPRGSSGRGCWPPGRGWRRPWGSGWRPWCR